MKPYMRMIKLQNLPGYAFYWGSWLAVASLTINELATDLVLVGSLTGTEADFV